MELVITRSLHNIKSGFGLFHLRKALLLHVVGFDAVAITALRHDIGQAHVLGIGIFDREAIRVLFFGHGQTNVLFVWVVN